MTTYVALLRGINVGGNNLIRMPALKAAFEADGYEDVRTYIQSGNVIFVAPRTRTVELTNRIEEMLAQAFDYVPTVVVRNRSQMRAIVDGAPPGFGSDPESYRYDVIFVKEPLTAKAAMAHIEMHPDVDAAHPGPGILYYSRLAAQATRSRLNKIVASPIYPNVTIRNWTTSTKLVRLMDDR